MFAFCVGELGFSEDVACTRSMVGRALRRPAGVHLAGLRVLVPHLTDRNHAEVLAQAAGRSKRDIGDPGLRTPGLSTPPAVSAAAAPRSPPPDRSHGPRGTRPRRPRNRIEEDGQGKITLRPSQ